MNREQIERLVERLRSYAQNNEMIDQHYTESGRAMNEAADALEGLASDAAPRDGQKEHQLSTSGDIGDEDPGSCIYCGTKFEAVRPGKGQPACDCYEKALDDAARGTP